MVTGYSDDAMATSYTRMRIWYAIATHLTDHAVVTWGAYDYGDRGSLTKMYLNAGHP